MADITILDNQEKEPYWLKNREIYMIGSKNYEHLQNNKQSKFDLGDHRRTDHMKDLPKWHIRILNPKDWRKRKKLGLKPDTVLVLFNTQKTKGQAYYFDKIFIENFVKERTEYLNSREPFSALAINLGQAN
jgi:hypothetical protein